MKDPSPVHIPPKLRQGREWHGWALKMVDEAGQPLGFFAEAFKPKEPPERGTEWVRVRFVEIKE